MNELEHTSPTTGEPHRPAPSPRVGRAVHYDRYGPPRQVGLRDLDVPPARSGEVVVKVRAAGVNRGDALAIAGLPYAARLSYGARGPRNPVPGTDVAGTVETVGPDVTAPKPGETVFGWAVGAFAEYAVAPSSRLLLKPDGVSFQQAAATPTPAVTALQALRAGRLRAGQRLLVIGASGGVGTFAVQLGRAVGATVTGVCSTGNVGLVRSLGADRVIDYTTGDLGALRGQFDTVVDLAGSIPLSVARHLVGPLGTYVVVGGGNPRSVTGMRRFASAVIRSPLGPGRLRPLFATPRREDLAAVSGLLAAGDVVPVVEAVYDLGDAADAIDAVHRGHCRGRVVLVP